MNMPNILTLSRIGLLPFFIFFLCDPTPLNSFVAALIFGVAAITDWLDGMIARRTGQVTKLGKLLDPIADKLLVSAALILLVEIGRAQAWIVIVLIGREFAVTGLRAIASSEGIVVPAEALGKYKMIAQITAILLLILNYRVGFLDFFLLGTVALWVSMVLAVWGGAQYFSHYWRQLGLDGRQ